MNEAATTRPGRRATFERRYQAQEVVRTNISCFLVFSLTLGVDGGSGDVAGHLDMLLFNQRLTNPCLSEAWITGLPLDSAKLVGMEGKQCVEHY